MKLTEGVRGVERAERVGSPMQISPTPSVLRFAPAHSRRDTLYRFGSNPAPAGEDWDLRAIPCFPVIPHVAKRRCGRSRGGELF